MTETDGSPRSQMSRALSGHRRHAHASGFSYAAQIKSIQRRDAHLCGLIGAELFMSNLVARSINPVFPKSESASVSVLLLLESFWTNDPSER